MKEHTPIGMNRTGMQISPLDSREMQQSGMPPSMLSTSSGDDTAMADMRSRYIAEAEPIGSVPVPTTVTGVVQSGMAMLTGNEPQLLLDKLGERLAFERSGTRLYDALITKFEALQDGTTSMTLADLQQIRDDEARHMTMVAEAISMMGGDPTSQTPSADLVGVESIGLMQVVSDSRTTLAQSLHALLIAEMTDNAGWELLIALAEEQGQGSMIGDFSVALTEEGTHLQRVRAWYEEATLGVALGDGALVDDVADANPSQPLH